jgi:glycerate 2-kinase
VPELETVYREALRLCAPDRLVREQLRPDFPRSAVAIGKAAGALFDGLFAAADVRDALVIVPRGYPVPRAGAAVRRGGHPQIDAESFEAGDALLRFVDQHDEILFLVSGGGSACVEAPLGPWFSRDDLIATNARLIDEGLAIEQINCVRKHLSAIKGGRLGARVRTRLVTLVYSDVASGDLAAVASGPTLPDDTTKEDAINILRQIGGCDRIVTTLSDETLPDTVRHIENATTSLVADNATLVAAAVAVARGQGLEPVMWDGEIGGNVDDAANALAERAAALEPGQVLVAGGEPTVVIRGDGRGGRCSELAVRFSLAAARKGIRAHALFGSSDGVDGNSGIAGVVVEAEKEPPGEDIAHAALARSDSLPLVEQVGRAVIMRPTGNNLRDLYLVARG